MQLVRNNGKCYLKWINKYLIINKKMIKCVNIFMVIKFEKDKKQL